MIGSYAMGEPAKAIEYATTEPEPSEIENLTLRELAERPETITFEAAVNMLLELGGDGRFTYYGSLKMGDDEAKYEGDWHFEEGEIFLALDTPVRTEDEVVRTLRCRYEPGVVKYPMGRDPRTPVYYRLEKVEP